MWRALVPYAGRIRCLAYSCPKSLAGLLEIAWAVGLKYTDGFGTIGTVIFAVVLFREPMTALRLAYIALIVAGTINLKIASPTSPS